MKVKELIEKLQNLNPDADVVRFDNSDGDVFVKKISSYEYKHTKVDKDDNEETEIRTAVELV